jgi:citrate lyase subunit beta/citryl-CoA lyase
MSEHASPTIASARSFLFVPGDRPDRFAKALASAAGIIILDLEDAVDAAGKEAARQAIEAFDPAGQSDRVLVRINAAGTADFDHDLKTCARARIGGVMLAKVQSRADVEQTAAGTNGLSVVALIESARGLANLAEIAAQPATQRLAFGSIDYCLDLGIAEDGPGLAAARSEIVLRSRIADLPAPIEGVTANFKDSAMLAADIQVARQFGFSAKLAIHPAQLEAIDNGFMPTAREVAWAEGIIAAAARHEGQTGSLAYAGEMIDKPVLLRATRILGSVNSLPAQR